MVKNPPGNAGGVSLIPGQGTKIPNARAQLSAHTRLLKPTYSGVLAPQLESVHWNERSHLVQEILCAAAKSQHSQMKNIFWKRVNVKDPALGSQRVYLGKAEGAPPALPGAQTVGRSAGWKKGTHPPSKARASRPGYRCAQRLRPLTEPRGSAVAHLIAQVRGVTGPELRTLGSKGRLVQGGHSGF